MRQGTDLAAAWLKAGRLLAVGFLLAGCSQMVVVPQAPDDGSATEVDVDWEIGSTVLDRPHYAYYANRLLSVTYRYDEEQFERYFGPAMGELRAILAAGLPELPHSYAVLMEPPRGPLGTLSIQVGERAPVELTQAGQGVYIDGYPGKPRLIDKERLQRDFGAVLEAQEEAEKSVRSYLVLLRHPSGPVGTLRFRPPGGEEMELTRANLGVFIDGGPYRPGLLDAQRLHEDFGPALEALTTAYKSLRSYIILLDSPDGYPSKVVFNAHGSERLLEQVGQSLTLDGYTHEAEDAIAEKDFRPARDATKEILEAGLPYLPHSYVAVLASPAGPLGEIEILEGLSQGVVLNEDRAAVIVDGFSSSIYLVGEDRLQTDFGDAFAATPPPPETFRLYFDPGSTRLTRGSRDVLAQIFDSIRRHPGADITIDGHTDTVGNEAINLKLSEKRSQSVADLIRKSGEKVVEITQDAYGQSLLAVETPDNTPEVLNRRVEVTIR